MLIDHSDKTSLDIQDEEQGLTALHFACILASNQPITASVALKLLEKDVNPNTISKDGTTPLLDICTSSSTSNPRITQLALKLIEHQANCLVVDNKGETVFHKACQANLTEVALKLLSTPNININTINSQTGFSPLFNCIENGNEILIHELLQRQVDVTRITRNGQWSILHCGAYHGIQENIMKQLINACKSNKDMMMKLKDKNGKTAQDIAREKGFNYLVELLN
jgi:ankyrin repeat protein